MNNRDPRIDPRHGDTVTVGNETREVELLTLTGVIYSWPGKVAVRSIYFDAWRAWAAPATSWTVASAEEQVA